MNNSILPPVFYVQRFVPEGNVEGVTVSIVGRYNNFGTDTPLKWGNHYTSTTRSCENYVPLSNVLKAFNQFIQAKTLPDMLNDLTESEIEHLIINIKTVNFAVEYHNDSLKSDWKIVTLVYFLIGKIFSLFHCYRFTTFTPIGITPIEEISKNRLDSRIYDSTIFYKEGEYQLTATTRQEQKEDPLLDHIVEMIMNNGLKSVNMINEDDTSLWDGYEFTIIKNSALFPAHNKESLYIAIKNKENGNTFTIKLLPIIADNNMWIGDIGRVY
jgi:hypothetical protein